MPTPHAQRAAAPHAQPAPHAHRDFDDAVTQPLTTADTALAAAAEGCAPNSPAGAASRARPEDAASAPRGSGNAQPGRAAAAAQRLTELDVLRALALSGILFVNIPQVMLMTGIVDREPLPMRHVLDLLVQQRFFPIFSLLFGVGFGIFLHRSAARAARPRVLLLRRLLLLAVFGAAHHVLQPGEALLPYAIAGVVVLLPLSFAPRWVNLAGGTVLLVLAAAVSGGLTLIPGLFLIGAALGRGDIARVLRCDVRVLATAAAVAVASAIGTSLWQEQDPLSAGFTTSSAVAGLCTAAVYVTGTLLVLRTPASGAITRVCAPVGRMALTNYVTATLLFVPLGHLLGLHGGEQWGLMALLAAAILGVQFGWSHLWLRHFRYGPLEWAWRCFTWWQVVPLRPTGAVTIAKATTPPDGQGTSLPTC